MNCCSPHSPCLDEAAVPTAGVQTSRPRTRILWGWTTSALLYQLQGVRCVNSMPESAALLPEHHHTVTIQSHAVLVCV